MTYTGETVEAPKTGRPARAWTGLLLGVIVGFAVGALIVQNTRTVTFHWLAFDGRLPLWAMLAASAVAGALLAKVLGFAWRHRSHDS